LSKNDFNEKTVLITAGPTAEDIDPVRFLTNRSTGKMGIALAEVAQKRGAKVILIIGPVETPHPNNIQSIKIRSAADMYNAVLKFFNQCDYYISAAAIADYTPIKLLENKIKKQNDNLIIELKRTKDILKEVGSLKTNNQKTIGFSVETENLIENSSKKLINKNLDMIIANNPKLEGVGFGRSTNQVEIITKSKQVSLPLMSKQDTAELILDEVLKLGKN